MSVPLTGWIFMAITLWFLVMRPDVLVALALVFHAFAAAAVVNFSGGFSVGITPYFFVAIMITLRLVPRWITGRLTFFEGEPVAAYTRVLAIFVVLCVSSAFVLPILFENLPVDVPRAGVVSHLQIPLAPLHWSPSNGGQAVYMILNFFVVLELIRKSTDEGLTATLTKALAVAGMLAAGVGLFQVACAQTGSKFPAWLFNTNIAWGHATQQSVGGFKRMSATFVEPSSAGGFFASWMVFELTFAISASRTELRHWLFATIATIALFLTTSSTGFVIAGVTWSVSVLQMFALLFVSGIVRIRKAAAIVGAISGAILVLLLVPGVLDLLNAILIQKQSTDSAIDRGATLGRALDVFMRTWGLGAGLGSNRAMSIAFYVLSNLGLLGTLLFAYLLVKPYLIARLSTPSNVSSGELNAFIRASGAAFAANFVGMMVSGAEITGAQFWLLLGMLLAGARQSWLAQRGVSNVSGDESGNLHEYSPSLQRSYRPAT
jgi:hypothetical protein